VNPWEELVSTALVGTERRQLPGDLASPASPLADDPEAVLLDRAALEVARRRAGWTAGKAEPLPPAREEQVPLVGRAAGQRLGRMLGGNHAGLLPEWLGAVAALGLRVPEHLLPELLDRGRGARGGWLARLNPDWTYLLAEGRRGPAARPRCLGAGRHGRATRLARLGSRQGSRRGP